MNLKKVGPKNETQDLLLSITKSCETLIHQIHTRPEETLEFEMIKPRETFHFNPQNQVENDCMLGLVGLEAYVSIFNITEKNNKFKLYKYPDGKSVSIFYEKVRDEIERDLDISDFTATDLQDDIIGPIIIEEYRNQVTKKMKDEKYMRIFAIYVCSVFQDFESFLRTEVDLVEVDIDMLWDEYNSRFIRYELTPGIHTFKDLSESLLKILQPEYESYHNAIDIEFGDNTRRTKLVVRQGIASIRFDEFFVFSTILTFNPHWDYKHYNQYISQKIVT